MTTQGNLNPVRTLPSDTPDLIDVWKNGQMSHFLVHAAQQQDEWADYSEATYDPDALWWDAL